MRTATARAARHRARELARDAAGAAALAEPDFGTFQFLQWCVREQHEEERLFESILDKIAVIGLDGKGIYFLDKEIRKLVGRMAAG